MYADLIEKAGSSDLHRYYRIEGGTHIHSLYDDPDPLFRENLRPIVPCYRAAFDRLVEWVEEQKPLPLGDPAFSQTMTYWWKL